MRYNSKTGFTLVEILVVMVLLAMAGSLVFVSTGKSVTGNRNRAFAREMISLCKTARRIAVDDGVPTAFNISSGQRRCWVGDSTKSLEIPEEMLIEGEGVSQLNEDVYTIGFYPDGSSEGGTLTLSISGKTVYAFRVDMITGMLTRIEEDA
jgi:general secretion pathway protein H